MPGRPRSKPEEQPEEPQAPEEPEAPKEAPDQPPPKPEERDEDRPGRYTFWAAATKQRVVLQSGIQEPDSKTGLVKIVREEVVCEFNKHFYATPSPKILPEGWTPEIIRDRLLECDLAKRGGISTWDEYVAQTRDRREQELERELARVDAGVSLPSGPRVVRGARTTDHKFGRPMPMPTGVVPAGAPLTHGVEGRMDQPVTRDPRGE